ncbi:MAG: cyclic beta 1-2 glucan synthetase, partial [Planctomycetaceae bacterium]|nr:cyclic beta 1-2 glucan synthetase [Planctomycetaceae bacterium]
MANPKFGTIASEAGAFHTWSENAHEFRLTPWRNNPVSDQPGECLYIRDEETGRFWSPTPLSCRSGGRFITRHGFGYSVYEHSEQGIHSELTVHVDRHDDIKFFTLSLKNVSDRQRNLSVTGYVEWVLGDIREKTGMHVITGIDSHSGALIARNHYNGEFRGRTVFLDVNDPGRTVTGDRREFLGRNRSLSDPRGMRRDSLSGRVGPGLDPCGGAQVKFNLGPGQQREVVFRLGVADNLDAARRLIRESRGVDDAHASLKAVKDYWREVLGTITVETPDQAFNFMANGWLLYQTLSCRFWGRSATYQSGGAIGFRDQLQDSMALLYAEPGLVRSHILECAAHQFPEGDVLHWWHPPSGRGVRTKCSDDYLWLAYCTERYIRVTGDTGILDEKIRFIQGRPLRDDEESYYDLMQKSDETASLYEHCRRSIQHGLRLGRHGLPLMGSGDWNDGMDLVGIDGAGESVWLAFFLYSVLMNFTAVAEQRGDGEYSALCRKNAEKLAESIRKNAWDGDWYRRAYFDDGTPLGSKDSPECSIDSIAQSWSVLSGAGDPDRLKRAMQSLDERLIDDDNLLVRLFTPAFNVWSKNPSYIKGYVPGVRENGGQYTHAAIWAAMAFAAEGDRENAWRLQKILNPISHGSTPEWADKYMAEPYVIAADIYT